jgi:hypothetical protein
MEHLSQQGFAEDNEEHNQLPDTNRLSVLVSAILLTYALSPYVDTAGREWNLVLPGLVFTFQFNLSQTISLLAAMMAAAGMDWLVRGHPRLGSTRTLQYLLIPALTTWAIGLPLNTLQVGTQWWVVFAMGGILLILVFIGEYISVDLTDARHVPATVGLTAVSFALYLILAVVTQKAEMRLYLMLPLLVLPLILVSLHTLYLRLGGRWCFIWAISIGLVTGEFAAGLNYLPIKPLTFGLLVLGVAYALTSLAGSIEEEHTWRTVWIEPVIMLVILWGLAALVSR